METVQANDERPMPSATGTAGMASATGGFCTMADYESIGKALRAVPIILIADMIEEDERMSGSLIQRIPTELWEISVGIVCWGCWFYGFFGLFA
ncbi:MAG: hypothetical protein ACRCV9_03050 [Burkholderiaceae bacterium]